MKKQLFALLFIIAGLGLVAQTPRMSLYEEFTGETCPPCASTNPGLDLLLQSGTNPSKIIPIKWQVPIPNAPTAAWSLYQTNKLEIDWRYRSTGAGGYGYAISSAPSARIDGQSAVAFGASGASADHPGNLTNTIINNAAAVMSPFAITMARAWDNTFSSVTLTINIQASQSFTSTGALVYRLVLIEKEIHFATQPGTNGEKDFNWVVRKSYPNIQTGTPMASTWVNGQNQTFTINCVLPSYIVDKAQVAFVGFVQDDGNRMVMQTAQTATEPLANDAKAVAIDIPGFNCGSTFVPKVSIYNNGSNAITTLTFTPKLDGVVGTPYMWAGNLAVGATTNIALPAEALTAGPHTYSYIINNVGGTDYNMVNNNTSAKFNGLAGYQANPVAEDFSQSFPPADWAVYSVNTTYGWNKSLNAGGFGLSNDCAKFDFFYAADGAQAEMMVQPMDLGGSQTPMMTFDVAYAQFAATYNDQLQVFASKNCGLSWTKVYDKAGSVLSTRLPIGGNSPWIPTAEQWRTDTIMLPGFNVGSVLVKFTATSNYGNNVYVDNVNLSQQDPTGIASVSSNVSSVELFPNPSNGETTLKINASSPATAKISVVNILGQSVYTQKAVLVSGTNDIRLNVSDYAAGVYNVVIDTNTGSIVKKLTVTK